MHLDYKDKGQFNFIGTPFLFYVKQGPDFSMVMVGKEATARCVIQIGLFWFLKTCYFSQSVQLAATRNTTHESRFFCCLSPWACTTLVVHMKDPLVQHNRDPNREDKRDSYCR